MRARHVAIAGAVVALALPVGAAPAQTAHAADGARITLSGQTRFVPGTDDATLVLRLSTTGLPNPPRPRGNGKADADPSPYEIVVLAQNPVVTRTAVRAAVDAAASSAPISDALDVVTVPYEDVRLRQGDLVVRVPVERTSESDDALFLPFALIYPVLVTVTRDGAPVARLQTFVERLPDGVESPVADPRGAMAVSIVGTVEGPPTLLPNGATRTDPDTVAELRRVTAALTTMPDVPITLGLRPEIVEGLDRSSEIADRNLLRELSTALGTRQLVSETYVRLDPSSMVEADLEDLYVSQLRRGEDALVRAFPSASTVRTAAVVDQPLTAEGADLLRDLGVRSALVLPSVQTSIGGTAATIIDPSQAFEIGLPSGGALSGSIVDPALTIRLSAPTDDPRLTAQAVMAELTAWLGEIGAQGGAFTGRSVVLTTADGRLPDATLLRALAALAAADPRFELTSLGQSALTTTVATVDGVPLRLEAAPDAGSDQSPLAYALGLTRSEMTTVGSMLPASDPRASRWQSLTDIAPSLDLDAAGRASYLDTILAEAAAVRGSVSGPPRTTFTLGGRTGDITLSLRNDADVALTVVVRLSSAKLLFPEGNQTVELAPDATTIVRVPVEARSNNTFPVIVELLTPNGLAPVTPPVQLTARVTALTGLGQLATGAGAIILATWWVRHWRTNRRRQMATALAAAPAQHPAAGRRTTGTDAGD